MKSILIKTLAFSLIAVSLWSCKKDEDKVVANVSAAGTLAASNTTVALSTQDAAKTAVTFTFPQATVTGYQVPVTSTLQFDLKGNNFVTAKEMVTTATTYSTTVADLNKMMLSLGATIGKPAELEVRLKSAAAANLPTYSNVITLSGTPYLASAWIYVPGAYQGWKPETADSLISLTGNGIYVGVIAFTEGNFGFKVTPAKKWDVAFGDAGGGKISTSGGDFSAPSAGLKTLTVDLNANTWKIEDTIGWGVIGDATPGGWNADTDMKAINDGKGNYQVKLDLVVGEIKFRFADAWDVNLGGADGKLVDKDGPNIKVATAGNYTITLNPEAKTYILTKN
ncbi:MAG: hypothetical protein JWQ28_86 [Pedobacter sp.]|nr:hypothetical protein [Pedobacter sp.]